MNYIGDHFTGKHLKITEYYQYHIDFVNDFLKDLDLHEKIVYLDYRIRKTFEKINFYNAEIIKRESEGYDFTDDEMRPEQLRSEHLIPWENFQKYLNEMKEAYEEIEYHNFKTNYWTGDIKQYKEFCEKLIKHAITSNNLHQLYSFFNGDEVLRLNVQTFDTVVIFETLKLNKCIAEFAVTGFIKNSKIICKDGKSKGDITINEKKYNEFKKKINQFLKIYQDVDDVLKMFDFQVLEEGQVKNK